MGERLHTGLYGKDFLVSSPAEGKGSLQIFLYRTYTKIKLIRLTKNISRLFQPVVAVKNVEAVEQSTTNDDGELFNTITDKDYQWVKISFRSTYLYNNKMINALNNCATTALIRASGKIKPKIYLGIDINEALRIYLDTYSCIGLIYHYIKHFQMRYRGWKYCHSPMLNSVVMDVVVVYVMYLECA